MSAIDRAALDELVGGRQRRLQARDDIIREGDRPEDMNLLLTGWACRYKTLEDGRRQITSFFLPGDICDLNVFYLRMMDHSIGALTGITYAEVPRATYERVSGRHPRILQALTWDTLVAMAVQREWTVNIGQRSAYERIGHLFCELFYRLRAVGLTDGDSCDLPFTQIDLADATGLTPVHVNRTLQELRANGLIRLDRRTLTLPDLAALKRDALFDPTYLHLDREGAHLDANDA
ncbi:Crp/Fnr family transcriptional regulator [Glacieibacterium sp.]|uniref:Crp/Fnr family transcriptional regulator n=1 Tax=Glacieibacterium sp. TaxID=2860237 RepID=UPI003B00735B